MGMMGSCRYDVPRLKKVVLAKVALLDSTYATTDPLVLVAAVTFPYELMRKYCPSPVENSMTVDEFTENETLKAFAAVVELLYIPYTADPLRRSVAAYHVVPCGT